MSITISKTIQLSFNFNLTNTLNMSKLFIVLACLALAVAVASAESKPKFAKLEKINPTPYCSMLEIVACEGEIEGNIPTQGLVQAA